MHNRYVYWFLLCFLKKRKFLQFKFKTFYEIEKWKFFTNYHVYLYMCLILKNYIFDLEYTMMSLLVGSRKIKKSLKMIRNVYIVYPKLWFLSNFQILRVDGGRIYGRLLVAHRVCCYISPIVVHLICGLFILFIAISFLCGVLNLRYFYHAIFYWR